MKTCVVVGMGPGNGKSLTRKFTAEGYRVAMIARSEDSLTEFESELDNTRAFPCDASDPEQIRSTLQKIAGEMGSIDALVWNAGAGVWGGLDAVADEDFERTWKVNTLGLFAGAKEVVPRMVENGGGSIAVIGAGAAWRGRAGTIAFAAAKASQRSVAQSIARQYGPDGVHVCYVVIDGVIDTPRTREWMSDKPDDFFLDPDDIALSVYDVCHQPKSAWTFELDVRPFGEEW